MSDSEVESYLILKYGSLHRAYNLWANWTLARISDQTEYDMINKFFAFMSLRDRMEIQK